MTRTRAIGADELREGHVLVGDSISPTRWGTGVTVDAVTTFADLVLVLAAGEEIEFVATETVHIVRRGDSA